MPARRTESPFDTYLREIQAWPLLSAEEERALARRIQAAVPAAAKPRARRSARNVNPLEELQEQMRLEHEAQEARYELTVRNLRLVVAEAKRWRHRGLPLPDVVEEGNVGLYHAVELFDPTRNVRFSTYATWWIRQAIRRALVNSVRTVRIPRHMSLELSRWRAFARTFEQREGRSPTPDEIARAMPGTPTRRRVLARIWADAAVSGRTVSLDALFDEDPRLPDTRFPSPGDTGVEASELEGLARAIAALEPREAEVVRARFGLGGAGAARTLREAGLALGLSRERVRQLEHRALAKLRASLRVSPR
ncbi:MAG TPA: sigma-70 family RNA polymerase sigma factor [Planctomycetota bacterium]|nr:sigma-70 family RNA polymerase sigma factor [Planctomycetota bacterium]